MAGGSGVGRGLKRASSGALGAVERGLENTGDALWRWFQRRAYIGIALATGAGVGVATLLGPGEVAIGAAAAYAAYLMLRRRLPPSKAFAMVFGAEKPLSL